MMYLTLVVLENEMQLGHGIDTWRPKGVVPKCTRIYPTEL